MEDYVPLWELPQQLAAAWPDESQRNAEDAQRIVRELFQRGLVEFYFSNNWDDGSLSQIPSDEVLDLLDDQLYWTPPMENENQVWIRMNATASGEEHCRKITPEGMWEAIVNRQLNTNG